MKSLVKLFIAFHVFMYRLTGGKFGSEMRGFKVLILTTKGRKSGKIFSNPVGYFERDGGYIIVASNGGARAILPGITTSRATLSISKACRASRIQTCVGASMKGHGITPTTRHA